jgi:outer membrane biosynthesis protein TonB
MLHRISLLAAVVMAALAISVTPALAGEDDGDPTTPPVTTTPAPVPPPAPAPAPQPAPQPAPKKAPKKAPKANNSGGSKSGKSNSSKGKSHNQTTRTYTPVVQQTYTIPQGGVQAGAGGTAPQDSGSALPVGLGLIGLTLAAGGFILRRRFVTE